MVLRLICPRKLGLQGLYRTMVLVNSRNLKINVSLDTETDLCTPSHLINQTKSFGGEVLLGTQETNFEFFFVCVLQAFLGDGWHGEQLEQCRFIHNPFLLFTTTHDPSV